MMAHKTHAPCNWWLMTRRRYPTPKQIAHLTNLARAAGIARVGAVTFSPDGAVRFTDAKYAQTEEDEIAQAAADLEAALGAS